MTRFNDFDSYQSREDYKYLPFRFDSFDEGHYILTNAVGEYLILEDRVFKAFINKKLSTDSTEFQDLRSKHFLYFPNEKTPLELLALKLRTKYSRLASFTNLHIFVITLRCDHSCPYCQVSRKSTSKTIYDMTQDMADKALEFTFNSPNPAIKIEFQGGEPLINFELVKYIVLQAEERNKKEGRDLQFVIATTLSLLTDEILDFCRVHRILLSSSLDGPEDLHNTNRPRPEKDSHQRFVSGLHRARAALGYDQVSALMTTTDRSLPRVKDIIDEYVRLGFNGIFLRALSPYGFAIKTKKFISYDTERWIEFYKEGLDYIIELNKLGVNFTEHFTALILQKMLSSQDPGFVDLMNPSGAGIAAIVFNYDGGIYASDESRMLAEMGDHTFRLGNILEDSYEKIMLSNTLLDTLESSMTTSMPMCSDCVYEPFCGTDPVYHHAIHGDIIGRKPESSFCQKNTAIFRHLIKLMESDEEVKSIFIQWAHKC